MALEAQGSNPCTHLLCLLTKFSVVSTIIMGYRQAVRHSTLTAVFAGSNPASPVKAMCLLILDGILAQVVEHLTFNQVVRGSNPRCLMCLRNFKLSRNASLEFF